MPRPPGDPSFFDKTNYVTQAAAWLTNNALDLAILTAAIAIFIIWYRERQRRRRRRPPTK